MVSGAGAAQPAALTLPLLPYKVVYAARLAEAGLIAPAVHYVGLVQAALTSLGAKVPPGLLVCRAMVAELEERLRTHALVRHTISLAVLTPLSPHAVFQDQTGRAIAVSQEIL